MASRQRTISNAQTTFTGDVIVSGDFTVSGTTTTVNVEDLTVEDQTITLFSGNTGDDSAADGAGIVVDAGTDADKTLLYDHTAEQFQSSIPVGLPDGAVGAPALSFSGDVDTGIYTPAADTVAISTGGQAAITSSFQKTEYAGNRVVFTYQDELSSSLTKDQIAQVACSSTGLYRVVIYTSALATDHSEVRNGYFDLSLHKTGTNTLRTIMKNTDAEWTVELSGIGTISISFQGIGKEMAYNLTVDVMSAFSDTSSVTMLYT